MAKVKQLEATNILTNEELEAVKQRLTQLEGAKGNIGDLEIQKGIAMSSYLQVAASFQALQKELEEKYGPINVDIATGEYTAVEKEDEPN